MKAIKGKPVKTLSLICLLFCLGCAAAEKANLVNISWGDHLLNGKGIFQLDTPERIEQALESWKTAYNGRIILWRISSDKLDRFFERRNQSRSARAHEAGMKKVRALMNPIEVARDACRKSGQKFFIYDTFLDNGAPETELYGGKTPFPWQNRVTIEHPEYQELDLAGNYHYGVPDLSLPAARRFSIEQLLHAVREYDPDGLYLCSRTHSVPALHGDQFGFGPEIVKEYQKRYGIDITKDPRFDYRKPEFAPASKEVENWRKLRGEYLLTFLEELKAALAGKTLYVGLPAGDYLGAPYGNLYLDFAGIIDRKLVDGIVFNVYSGRGLYRENRTPHRELGYLSSAEDGFNSSSMAETAKKWGPRCRRQEVALFYSVIGFNSRLERQAAADPNLSGLMFLAQRAPSFTLPDVPALRTGPLSAEGWFYRYPHHRSKTAPRLISKYAHDAKAERGWELSVTPDNFPVFRVHLKTPRKRPTDFDVQSSIPAPRGEWVHIAGVFDPGKNEIRVYVNGQLGGRTAIPAGAKLNQNDTVDLAIGTYAGDLTLAQANALVDEVRIVNAALDFDGAPAAPYTGKEPDTVLLMHFDEAGYEPATAVPGLEKATAIGVTAPVPGKFGRALNLAL